MCDRRGRLARWGITCALLGAALAVSSCGLQKKGGDLAGPAPGEAPAWPFAPVELNIHPLTRFITDPQTGEVRIEAHIELIDEHGDEVKGLGTLLLMLYRELGPVPGVESTGQLKRWTLDLSDIDENNQAYDRVTRTYRIGLTGLPPDAQSGQNLRLTAQLTTPDGMRLRSTRRLGL